ncbi:GntR family transcriptional regulator [Paramicrobacterium chengjingii]|uniref:GntR family transcriptional regulator n=1 Tax=Paramicrobacterium chengjingii TaxID=2769067 RepID=UPI00141F1F04|nr:GntR family transcriptional regulator [Microbacterium chengjingii]
MTVHEPRSLKQDLVSTKIRQAIHDGRYGRGSMLPGEVELAQQFDVSRGTVRKALQELSNQNLIETRSGVGSFVMFDDHEFSDSTSWGQPLVGSDVTIESKVLRMERIVDHELAATVGLASVDFLALDRTRHVVDGKAVSLERSKVPAVGALARTPEDGLVDGSLASTMAAAGLVPARIEQWIGIAPLSAADAAILSREPGDLFLHLVRIARAADGAFVERVVSLLDPTRFRVHVVSGDLK